MPIAPSPRLVPAWLAILSACGGGAPSTDAAGPAGDAVAEASADGAPQAGCGCGSVDAAAPCLGTEVSYTQQSGPFPSSTVSFRFRCDGGACACGRFGNGYDAWVAPRVPGGVVEIVDMAPATLGDADRTLRHGWVANPSATAIDSFMDGRLGGGNATGRPLRPTTSEPLQVATAGATTTTLVKAHSVTELARQDCRADDEQGDVLTRHCFWQAGTLTVLPAVPPGAGSSVLRPPLTGPAKPLVPISSIDFDALPALPVPALPSGLAIPRLPWAAAVALLATPKVEWGADGNWPYWQMMPPLYNFAHAPSGYPPRSMAPLHDALQLLIIDDRGHEAERRALAIAAVQWGVDLYFMWKAQGYGAMFRPNGGHAVGRYLPVVLAAALLTDETGAAMKADLQRVNAGDADACGFDIPAELTAWPDTGRVLYGYRNRPGCDGYTSYTQQTNSCMVDPAHLGDNGRLAVNGFNTAAAVASCAGAYQPITAGPTLSAANVLRAIPAARAVTYPPLFTYAARVFEHGAYCRPDQGGGYQPLVGRCAGGVDVGRVCIPGADCPGSTCVGHGLQYGSALALHLWQAYQGCYDAGTCPGM